LEDTVGFVAVVGIILIVVAGVLLWIRRSKERRLHAIAGTETSSIASLTGLAKAVRDEIGGETGFHQIAEVKGQIRSDSPLTSEAARQLCVYYQTSVTREYEETYWDWEGTGENRHRVQRTRRSSETVASNTQQVDFWVEDATGRIRVNPNGADVDAQKVVDRFDPAPPPDLGSILGQLVGAAGGRTIGYRTTESVLPVDRQVYVLGEVSDASGELTLHAPGEKGRQYIISLKSEEELIGSGRRTAQGLLIGAVASGALGVIALLFDFFT
jgi:hypothetical protein